MSKLLSFEEIGQKALESIEVTVSNRTGMSCWDCVEKQIPKKPDIEGDGYDPDGNLVYDTWICPSCNTRYEIDYDNYKYCPNCGQSLDLSELE